LGHSRFYIHPFLYCFLILGSRARSFAFCFWVHFGAQTTRLFVME